MRETQINHSRLRILEDLAGFDVRLESRIEEIRAGLSPNGESPNGVLSQALQSGDPKDETAFINEYDWALSLTAFPYRGQESQAVLRSAAIDGLFMAGETYNPEREPNFLKHMASTVRSYLKEVFGEVDTYDLPSADEFETFVLIDWQSEDLLSIAVEDGSPSADELESPSEKTIVETVELPPLTAVEQLERLGPRQRMAAYRAGGLTRRQLTIWAGRFPDEIPMINGEVEWIALTLADLE